MPSMQARFGDIKYVRRQQGTLQADPGADTELLVMDNIPAGIYFGFVHVMCTEGTDVVEYDLEIKNDADAVQEAIPFSDTGGGQYDFPYLNLMGSTDGDWKITIDNRTAITGTQNNYVELILYQLWA